MEMKERINDILGDENIRCDIEQVCEGYYINGFKNIDDLETAEKIIKQNGIESQLHERKRNFGGDWQVVNKNAKVYSYDDYHMLLEGDNNLVITGDGIKNYIEDYFQSTTTIDNRSRLDFEEIAELHTELASLIDEAENYDKDDILIIENNEVLVSYNINDTSITDHSNSISYELALFVED